MEIRKYGLTLDNPKTMSMDLVAGSAVVAVTAAVAASVKSPAASVVVLYQHANHAPVVVLASNVPLVLAFNCSRREYEAQVEIAAELVVLVKHGRAGEVLKWVLQWHD
ncbi:hypothetical protein MKW98_006691 [Papaver atlanticum]|uniref:Uncharacterized protein n=1 Tax=Papaver atlanticum TaxID=357466 RepID=A0AAD4T2U2_9MAGN|nr:hypothetical protein MKW98_006691 [Papaver atlanticum]